MPIQLADWAAIEKFMMLTEDYSAAAKHFAVKEDTIRKRAKRHAWPLPSVVAAKALALKNAGTVQSAQNGAIIEQSAKTLAERGEEHAKTVFDLASGALKALKKLPVRNWKDAEIADKAARRAAGLGNDDEGVRISLISLNESINAHDTSEDVIEATLIPDDPESESPIPALPDSNQSERSQ